MNGYVDAGYSVVLASLALYAGRLVLRRRTLERWLPERGEPVREAVPADSPVSTAHGNEPGGPEGKVPA